eukprot:jgi/Ulvmu1/2720/UM014_0177.1
MLFRTGTAGSWLEGTVYGCVVIGSGVAVAWVVRRLWIKGNPRLQHPVAGILGCVGNTPLIEISSLSQALGCRVLAKAEFLNPGGSIKDRIAVNIVQQACASGRLQSGGLITEATAGSTGVSLALVAAALGLRCHVFMPDDVAIEKAQELMARGASVSRVPPVSIAHPEHMVNQARIAAEKAGGFFADQFENLHNAQAHLQTGEEILKQCKHVDAFVCGAGTGGTIAGVSQVLKRHCKNTRIYLVDPPGSSLFLKVKRGVVYTQEEAEGRRTKNPFDTVTEGLGLNRLTKNFMAATIDDAVQCSDQEAVDMAQFLLRNEGLYIGSSSAVNCVGAVKAARQLGKGKTIITILCDGGNRHLSKFLSEEFLTGQDLLVRDVSEDLDLSFVH